MQKKVQDYVLCIFGLICLYLCGVRGGLPAGASSGASVASFGTKTSAGCVISVLVGGYVLVAADWRSSVASAFCLCSIWFLRLMPFVSGHANL
ncbi:hypothetical protein DsansV1_C01g0006171 [Dioscorea sansibarensis]